LIGLPDSIVTFGEEAQAVNFLIEEGAQYLAEDDA
jgi:hypothetical protein